jgi:hypothetical protein
MQGGAGGPGQNADGGTASEKVSDHLRSDLRRIGADPVLCDAVTSREDAQAKDFRPRMGCGLEAAQPHADLLEETEGPGGFGLEAESPQQGAFE